MPDIHPILFRAQPLKNCRPVRFKAFFHFFMCRAKVKRQKDSFYKPVDVGNRASLEQFKQMIQQDEAMTIILKADDHRNPDTIGMVLDTGNVISSLQKGGIDLNSANLRLQDIKRDGRGVPLPLAQPRLLRDRQDMAQLGRIQGFEAEIIEIRPVTSLPIFNELQQKFQ